MQWLMNWSSGKLRERRWERKLMAFSPEYRTAFGQISDTILATDRARREAAEWEAKLASLSSRSFDITKLQADLDYINKENELLEQLCHDRNNAKQNKCHDAAL
ncbi:hypothetical protein HPP92_017878 [Vanilla planifolia]|uniref:Uncharacterized protein n=1 Tax=Vanilla planifolia TaxID=51239 RepID=A0A835ULX3_VANPL|nr:hypothetical protein HPP92_017878 [Vanilla planifolia]